MDPIVLPCNFEAFAYIFHYGAFLVEEKPIALAAMNAENRQFSTKTTKEMIKLVQSLIQPESTVESFVFRSIEDVSFREQTKKYLHSHAQDFLYLKTKNCNP